MTDLEELGRRVFDVVRADDLRLVKLVDLDNHASDWRNYGACITIERAFLKQAVTRSGRVCGAMSRSVARRATGTFAVTHGARCSRPSALLPSARRHHEAPVPPFP